MITPLQLKAITNIKDVARLTELTNALNDTLAKYEINTVLRQCHFLAQILHESSSLTTFKEGLNYSAKGLTTTFHKYFLTEEAALPYARQPQKIANKVYGGRMGNGDEASGDGFKFSGKGAIQVTGRDNYTALSKATGIDFVNNPTLLESNKYAVLSSGWFWDKTGLNIFADKDDILTITKKINGGLNGIDSRTELLNKVKSIIK